MAIPTYHDASATQASDDWHPLLLLIEQAQALLSNIEAEVKKSGAKSKQGGLLNDFATQLRRQMHKGEKRRQGKQGEEDQAELQKAYDAAEAQWKKYNSEEIDDQPAPEEVDDQQRSEEVDDQGAAR